MILETIHSPADVKQLDQTQLPQLCRELREFLVRNVSQTGGHLASNLGAVELTVAIHRVFDTETDRLVFDVGHQCYVHKALTGRQELFSTLRQFQGLSGFPKPYESVHDAFVAGHASNSVSVALGMARARTMQKKDYNVLALIGDGALTGGLAYEGLNNAGGSGEPLVVILNDNGMSIDPNVGAMPSHLGQLRSKPAYYHFKKWYRGLFGKEPMKNAIYCFNHRAKTALKKTIWPRSTLFEDMGFTYLGPIDGHDLPRLCDMLQWAKEQQGPVLVHVHTVKGKGYEHAERHPGKFHGIGPFDPESGQLKKAGGKNFSDVFGEVLTECAAEDPRVCAITAAMAEGTGLGGFAKTHPDRFCDVAIAEGHGVAMAAGLASQGMIPVFAVYSTFLQRGYDQLIHDVALEQHHVVLGVDRAGLVGEDGSTHHGAFDLAFLRPIPNLTIASPLNEPELRNMMYTAQLPEKGTFVIRYPRGCGNTVDWKCDFEELPVGKGRKLKEEQDIAVLSLGPLGLEAHKAIAIAELESLHTRPETPLSIAHYDMRFLKPIDEDLLHEVGRNFKKVVTVEDGSVAGGLGSAVLEFFAEHGYQIEVKRIGIPDEFVTHGTVAELRRACRMDAKSIAEILS